MKKTITLLALVLTSTIAFAGGGQDYPPPPKQQPPAQPSNSKSDSSSSSGAQAGAIAGSRSGASAYAPSTSTSAGGNATSAGGANSLGSVGNDNSVSRFNALALALPGPAFTPPLPAIADCPAANVHQGSRYFGLGFGLLTLSDAAGDVNTDNCTTIRIYQSLMARCKYASANLVLAHLTVKVLPDYRPEESGDIDLTDRECAALSAPIVQPSIAPVDFLQHLKPAPMICPAPSKAKPHQVRKPRGCRP